MSGFDNQMAVIRVSLKHYGILEEIAQDNDTNIMIIADELIEIGLKHSKYGEMLKRN